MSRSEPPKAFKDFVERFPKAAEAWNLLRDQESEGPFDSGTQRLLKLAIAIGAQKPGAVHSAARKARAAGVPQEQAEHLVALAASTLGLPAAVAALGWIREEWQAGDSPRA